jgi:hypothetical protein
MGLAGRAGIPAAALLLALGSADGTAEMAGKVVVKSEQAAVKSEQAAEMAGKAVVKGGQLVVNCDLVSFNKTLSSWYRDV